MIRACFYPFVDAPFREAVVWIDPAFAHARRERRAAEDVR